MELYLCSPSTPSWRGPQLKAQGNFTFLPSTFKATVLSHHKISLSRHVGIVDNRGYKEPTWSGLQRHEGGDCIHLFMTGSNGGHV